MNLLFKTISKPMKKPSKCKHTETYPKEMLNPKGDRICIKCGEIIIK
jgi:hypothetical protein